MDFSYKKCPWTIYFITFEVEIRKYIRAARGKATDLYFSTRRRFQKSITNSRIYSRKHQHLKQYFKVQTKSKIHWRYFFAITVVIRGCISRSQRYIVGEHRVPIIFVNKKSNFSIKNQNIAIKTLSAMFP